MENCYGSIGSRNGKAYQNNQGILKREFIKYLYAYDFLKK
jgi:hypothetical protein